MLIAPQVSPQAAFSFGSYAITSESLLGTLTIHCQPPLHGAIAVSRMACVRLFDMGACKKYQCHTNAFRLFVCQWLLVRSQARTVVVPL